MNDILADQPQLDPNKSYYEELVGEGRKYKDNETMARSNMHKDTYIKFLETRADEMREDITAYQSQTKERASLEELIDQLNKRPQMQQPNSDTNANGNNKPSIDLDQFSDVVRQQIRAEREEERANANVKIVTDKLKAQYGDNFSTAVKQQIAEIGLSQEDFNTLARRSPETLFRALGVNQQQQRNDFQSPPRSSERRDSFSPQGAQERTWSWWQNLRKENPTSYYSPKLTVQRMEDAEKLGDKFADGNFEVLGRHRVPLDAVKI